MLVTGATGKVGQTFIKAFLADPRFSHSTLRALCHNRVIEEQERVEVVKGSISSRDDVQRALEGVTHILHLATCKETPDAIMDVAIKGMFWLLEESRLSPSFQQLILVGGDAGMGHFVYPHPIPVTETQKHSAYQGCYALSKVLEEVMLEQYYIQYGLGGCCLRAPWIMEKDDFKYTLSFGEDVFGGPRVRDIVGAETADKCVAAGTVPILCDPNGQPIKRNFVHVDDLVSAILAAIDHPKAHQQTFNICMDEPVDYASVGEYLNTTRGLPTIHVPTPYHSTWLDNAKARFLLNWKPVYDTPKLIEAAYNYKRPQNEPRIIWYPG